MRPYMLPNTTSASIRSTYSINFSPQTTTTTMFTIFISSIFIFVILLCDYCSRGFAHQVLTSNTHNVGVNGGSHHQLFSGVYRPDIIHSANDFSAAWLLSKERLIIAKEQLQKAENMAGATFAVVRHKTDKTFASLVTRDYFDFFVEHLSSTSNQIPHSNSEVMKEQTYKLNQTAYLLQHSLFKEQNFDHRLDQTLAVLVFSSMAFSVPKDIPQHSNIRIPYFLATYHSISRYFGNICIFVGNDVDRQLLLANQIPAWMINVMNVPLDVRNYTTALPRESILYMIERLKGSTNPRLMNVKYVYFSEGDQILHMRHIKELYNLIDESNGKFVIVPHRMNTMPLVQDLSPHLHNVFEPDSAFRNDQVHLVIEDLYNPRGSCCDAGRYDVAPCYGWWYQCKEWGIRDMSPWFKLGNYGFTFPPATEHRSKCKYSPTKRICDLPVDCKIRTPRREINETTIEVQTLCGPHSFVDKLGPESAQKRWMNLLQEQKKNSEPAKHKELEQLQSAEHELQLLLTEVMRLRRRIRTSRHYLKQHFPHLNTTISVLDANSNNHHQAETNNMN